MNSDIIMALKYSYLSILGKHFDKMMGILKV